MLESVEPGPAQVLWGGGCLPRLPIPAQCLTHGGFGVLCALCSLGARREQFETVNPSSQAAASSGSTLPEGFHPVVLDISDRVKATFI